MNFSKKIDDGLPKTDSVPPLPQHRSHLRSLQAAEWRRPCTATIFTVDLWWFWGDIFTWLTYLPESIHIEKCLSKEIVRNSELPKSTPMICFVELTPRHQCSNIGTMLCSRFLIPKRFDLHKARILADRTILATSCGFEMKPRDFPGFTVYNFI